MSGPSALGTLLVQRLDAVLGTQIASHANMIAGLRADAVAQPGAVARDGRIEGEPSPQARAASESSRDQQVAGARDAKMRTALEIAGNARQVRQDSTPSAPTSLGKTARTILALLAQFPDDSPPLAGRAPLWQGPAGNTPADSGAASARAGNAGTAAPNASAPDMGGNAARGTAAQTTPGPAAAQGANAATISAPPSAGQLVQALRHAIQTSGLFYESHLGDFAFGEKTAAQLRAEPQGRLPAAGASAGVAEALGGGTAAKGGADASSAPAAGARQHAVESSLLSSQIGASDSGKHASATTAQPSATGVHPEAALMVRQQLDVLAHQAIAWRGEAWHGADMDWDIRKDPGPDESAPTWSTRLALTLPRLGEVQARISLAGDQVVMRIQAPTAQGEISEAGETLRARFGAAGLTLSNLTVSAQAAPAHAPMHEWNTPSNAASAAPKAQQ